MRVGWTPAKYRAEQKKIAKMPERHYKNAGYFVKTVEHKWDGDPDMGPFYMRSAFTANGGDYIGDPKTAHMLCAKRGIAPEKRSPKHKVCSIGWCEREKKWYGWSHRAIYGFGVGSVVKKGDCHAERLKIGFKAKTLADAKKMAKAFAESVS